MSNFGKPTRELKIKISIGFTIHIIILEIMGIDFPNAVVLEFRTIMRRKYQGKKSQLAKNVVQFSHLHNKSVSWSVLEHSLPVYSLGTFGIVVV